MNLQVKYYLIHSFSNEKLFIFCLALGWGRKKNVKISIHFKPYDTYIGLSWLKTYQKPLHNHKIT